MYHCYSVKSFNNENFLFSQKHLVTFQVIVDSLYTSQVLYKLLRVKRGIFNELGLPYHLEKLADGKYSNFLSSWLVDSNKKE